ncbi:MAG: ABC transporter permease, partial [Paraclostridium sp.]
FNVITISRYKIIDLVNANKKVENIKFKNPIVYVLTFFISTYFLLTSYKLVLNLVPNEITNFIVLKIIGFGILGTFLFFYSLAGVFLYITKKNKKIYFKNLNIFIIKQLNSKINTNFLSISVICLMLFLTIVMLSTGIGFKNASEKILIDSTPFDVSIYLYGDEYVKTVKESLDAINFKFDDTEKYVYFDIYDSGVNLKNIINKKELINKYILSDEFDFYKIELIKISDYNNIRKLKGENTASLKGNEVILTSNNRSILDILNKDFEKNKKISLYNKEYIIKNGEVVEESLKSSPYLNNIATLIVNDNVVQNAEPMSSNLNVQFTKNKERSEKKFRLLLDSFKEGKIDYNKAGFLNGDTKQEIYLNNKGAVTIVLFIEMYLGIIFLISSMAILAIQQLSEASDSIERYKSIERLGANENMINKTIFIQTLIYFGLPISLAFIHSIVGIKVIYNAMEALYNPDIKYTLISTAIIFVVVYFAYFYTTYIGYKSIVKNSK